MPAQPQSPDGASAGDLLQLRSQLLRRRRGRRLAIDHLALGLQPSRLTARLFSLGLTTILGGGHQLATATYATSPRCT